MSVNRQLPGPSIQVCQDDIVVVDVENDMVRKNFTIYFKFSYFLPAFQDGTATTIHWHGLRQKGTPFADGVPFLTQCPIYYGTTFRYAFYARDAGTHLWHSHAGQHKANGIYGPIVVRKQEEKSATLYDYDPHDFFVLASDWMHVYAEQYFPGLTSKLSIFESMLINGHGRFLNVRNLFFFSLSSLKIFFQKSTGVFSEAPLTIYNVAHQKRYRFRVINGASNVCPFVIQIENHELLIIASDGSTFDPVKADTLYFISGERYDAVVTADKDEIRDYWVRIRALPPCTKQIEEFAILRYHKGEVPNDAAKFDFDKRRPPTWDDRWPDKRLFNSPQPDIFGISVAVAKSHVGDKSVTEAEPDYKFTLFLGTPQYNNDVLFSGDNNIKFMGNQYKELCMKTPLRLSPLL